MFGTAQSEQITLLSGDVTLDPSFNRGGDTIRIDQPADAFAVVRLGSSLVLDSATLDIQIPVGQRTTLIFWGDDERSLLVSEGAILIGSQVIGLSPVVLTEFA